MFEIYKNDINDDIFNSKPYHNIKLQKIKLNCVLYKYLLKLILILIRSGAIFGAVKWQLASES